MAESRWLETKQTLNYMHSDANLLGSLMFYRISVRRHKRRRRWKKKRLCERSEEKKMPVIENTSKHKHCLHAHLLSLPLYFWMKRIISCSLLHLFRGPFLEWISIWDVVVFEGENWMLLLLFFLYSIVSLITRRLIIMLFFTEAN